MLRGVWQALNCLSIHATHCVIIAGASPGETKLWAAVRENGDFFCICGSNNWETVVETGKLRWATYRFDPYDQHNLFYVFFSSNHDVYKQAKNLRKSGEGN